MLAVARIAAIQAVKKTSDFIPLAHGGVPVEGCIARVEPVGPSRSDPQPESPASSREERKIEEAMRLSGPIGTFGGVRISVQVETTAKTGVEMEALTGVVGAALTVVDMCKSVDKGCVVSDVKVTGKKGGLSGGLGIWRRGLSGGSKELRDWKLSEREGGMVKGSMRVVDEGSDKVEKEDVCEQAAENERLRKAKTCKRWTRDLIPE